MTDRGKTVERFSYVLGFVLLLAFISACTHGFGSHNAGIEALTRGVFQVYFFGLAFLLGGGALVIIGAWCGGGIYEFVHDAGGSILEQRLTKLWAAVAGAYFPALLVGLFYYMGNHGYNEARRWFVGVCYAAGLLPWFIFGYLCRKALRYFFPPSEARRRAHEDKNLAIAAEAMKGLADDEPHE